MLRARDDEHGAVLRTGERADEQLEADGERERLVRLLPAEGDELLGPCGPGEDVPVRHGSHGHVRDDRPPSLDGIAIASGFVPVSGGPPSGCGSRRGEVAVSAADEAGSGETAHPVPEDTRREAALRDDHARVRRRAREHRAHDLVEHEVAERAVPVPALEPVLGEEPARASCGVDLLRLEPGHAGQPMPVLSAPVGVREVREQDLDGVGIQPEAA